MPYCDFMPRQGSGRQGDTQKAIEMNTTANRNQRQPQRTERQPRGGDIPADHPDVMVTWGGEARSRFISVCTQWLPLSDLITPGNSKQSDSSVDQYPSIAGANHKGTLLSEAMLICISPTNHQNFMRVVKTPGQGTLEKPQGDPPDILQHL